MIVTYGKIQEALTSTLQKIYFNIINLNNLPNQKIINMSI